MRGKKRIIIAGGGIAGLTLALALVQRGIPVRVHEQVADPGEVGAGLQLSANGIRCLFSLGLEHQLRAIATVPEGKEVRLWNTGQRWKLFDLGAESERAFGFPYLMLHRGDLHGMLLDALRTADPSAIRTGSRCTGFTQEDGAVQAQLEDGGVERGAALIGADGVHSVVRAAMFGNDQPQFTGCMAWRGVIPVADLPPGLVGSVATNWVGPGAHVITYSLRGGQLVNFVGIVERDDWREESWTQLGTVDECAGDFRGWHEDVQTLIRSIRRPYKWALMGREPLANWTRGRVTLMGDAAHPTLPFLAQGAVMAIEDALVLARCIDAHGDRTEDALQRYQALRIDRTTRIVRGSAQNGQRFHNPALAEAEGAARYVTEQWAEDKVRERYHWLFEYDALQQPTAPVGAAA